MKFTLCLLLFLEFISQMPGPVFLGFYAALGGIGLLTGWIARRMLSIAGTGRLKLPDLSNSYTSLSKMYQISFLRKGSQGLTEMILLSLIHRGYLQRNQKDDSIIEQNPEHPPLDQLTKIEVDVFDCFTYPMNIREAFKVPMVQEVIKDASNHYEEELVSNGLILTEKQVSMVKQTGNILVIALAGIGLWRIFSSIAGGHYNIAFLLILCIVFPMLTYFATRLSRITEKGKHYMRDLRLAFRNIRQEIQTDTVKQQFGNEAFTFLPLVSIFGMSVLSDSSDLHDVSKLEREQGGSSFGCSSGSCGSSSCSSSSGGSWGCGGGGDSSSSSCGGGGGGGGCGGGCS